MPRVRGTQDSEQQSREGVRVGVRGVSFLISLPGYKFNLCGFGQVSLGLSFFTQEIEKVNSRAILLTIFKLRNTPRFSVFFFFRQNKTTTTHTHK